MWSSAPGPVKHMQTCENWNVFIMFITPEEPDEMSLAWERKGGRLHDVIPEFLAYAVVRLVLRHESYEDLFSALVATKSHHSMS